MGRRSTRSLLYFFSSRRRHTRLQGDRSSDVCSSDLQALFHLVMERHVELGLDVVVALEAQGRLSNFEQLLFILACMNAVTADATHIGLGVSGAVKVGVLSRVATQTTGIHFLRRSLGRIEYLGDVSATRW